MITLNAVGRRFGTRSVLEDLSLVVERGAAVAITGRSGSGKSTLLRLIAGLDLPDAGQVLLDGQLASRPGWALAPHRRGIGFMFQSPALWPHMSVARNILFGLAAHPREVRLRRLHEVLARTGIEALAHRLPNQLSGGEASRVALARTLAPEPPILLLDEPLTHQDAELKTILRSLVGEHVHRTGATLLCVTHDPAEFEGIAGRVLTLEHGRLS